MKTKTFNVKWEESFSVNVKAKNKEEAIKMVHECRHDEGAVSSEISAMPEAYETA